MNHMRSTTKGTKFARILGIVAFLASQVTNAYEILNLDGSFDHLRVDRTVPQHCRQLELNDFSERLSVITYSIEGAVRRGFTHEYPIRRNEARLLWEAVKKERPSQEQRRRIEADSDLYNDYVVLQDSEQERGFDYANEGEVLEALALEDLELLYERDDYFVTGSVAYHRPGVPRYIGELDLIIGDRTTCKVFAIGEAKLGLHRLGKAKEQIHRFLNYLGHQRRQKQLLTPTDILVNFASAVGEYDQRVH